MNTVQTAVQHLETARMHMWLTTIAIVVIPVVGTLVLRWVRSRKRRKALAQP